jgi:hypothetical protein
MKRRIGYGILIAVLLAGNGILICGLVFASEDLGEDSTIRTSYRTEKIRNYVLVPDEADRWGPGLFLESDPDEIIAEDHEEIEDVPEGVIEELHDKDTEAKEESLEEMDEEIIRDNEEEETEHFEEAFEEEDQQTEEEPVEEIPVVKGSPQYQSWQVPLRQRRDPTADSPEIYFHVKNEITLDLSIHIKDGVTTTIPEVDMGPRAEWKDLLVHPDGSVEYNGQTHDMLYYEGRFVSAYGPSDMGWEIAKIDGRIYFDGLQVTEDAVLKILKLKMMVSGLESDEISFIIRRILDEDMLSFETEYLYIRYIPQNSVDEAIQLEVPDVFSVMRRHFLFEASDDRIDLSEPEYEAISGEYVIHETAVNRI